MMKFAKGFTLIELLIVVFIISIVTSVALLTISHNENKNLETFANQLVELITLAEEEAMLQPTVLGLKVSAQQIQFVKLITNENKKEMRWQVYTTHVLAIPNMPENIQLDIRTGSKTRDVENNQPQIIFSTNGDVTPFTIYIGKKGDKPRYSILGRTDGSVKSQIVNDVS